MSLSTFNDFYAILVNNTVTSTSHITVHHITVHHTVSLIRHKSVIINPSLTVINGALPLSTVFYGLWWTTTLMAF